MSNGKIIKLDQTLIDEFPTEDEFYILTAKQASMLLSITQFLEWETRWNNLTMTHKQLLQARAEIDDRLMTPVTVQSEIENCEDVEDCLETSLTITNIQGDITTAQADITTAQSTANSAQSTADQAQQAVDDLSDEAPANEYPETPTFSEPDVLCASSWYIASELHDVINDLILGTAFSNLIEFVNYYLLQGGWKYTSLVELWNLFQANSNPNLATEVFDAIEYVAEAFYCNELDRDLALIDINASTNMTADAIALYDAVIEAWLNNKFALATAIGRENSGEDCSGFCYDNEWGFTWSGAELAEWVATGGRNPQFDGDSWNGGTNGANEVMELQIDLPYSGIITNAKVGVHTTSTFTLFQDKLLVTTDATTGTIGLLNYNTPPNEVIQTYVANQGKFDRECLSRVRIYLTSLAPVPSGAGGHCDVTFIELTGRGATPNFNGTFFQP